MRFLCFTAAGVDFDLRPGTFSGSPGRIGGHSPADPATCVTEAFALAKTEQERWLITQLLSADFVQVEGSGLTCQQALLVSYRLVKGTAIADLSLAHAASFHDLRGWLIPTARPEALRARYPEIPAIYLLN